MNKSTFFILFFILSFVLIFLRSTKAVKSDKVLIIPGAFMILVLFMIFSINKGISKDKQKIVHFIDNKTHTLHIKLNDSLVFNPDEILSDIKSLNDIQHNHPNRINLTKVEIYGKSSSIVFYIEQDSHWQDEFWIKMEKTDTYIGGFKSQRLKNYFPKKNANR